MKVMSPGAGMHETAGMRTAVLYYAKRPLLTADGVMKSAGLIEQGPYKVLHNGEWMTGFVYMAMLIAQQRVGPENSRDNALLAVGV